MRAARLPPPSWLLRGVLRGMLRVMRGRLRGLLRLLRGMLRGLLRGVLRGMLRGMLLRLLRVMRGRLRGLLRRLLRGVLRVMLRWLLRWLRGRLCWLLRVRLRGMLRGLLERLRGLRGMLRWLLRWLRGRLCWKIKRPCCGPTAIPILPPSAGRGEMADYSEHQYMHMREKFKEAQCDAICLRDRAEKAEAEVGRLKALRAFSPWVSFDILIGVIGDWQRKYADAANRAEAAEAEVERLRKLCFTWYLAVAKAAGDGELPDVFDAQMIDGLRDAIGRDQFKDAGRGEGQG
jgi:hypothetical protein